MLKFSSWLRYYSLQAVDGQFWMHSMIFLYLDKDEVIKIEISNFETRGRNRSRVDGIIWIRQIEMVISDL